MLRGDAGQVLPPEVRPGQQWQGDDASRRMGDEQSQVDEDVPVNVGRSGRAGVGL